MARVVWARLGTAPLLVLAVMIGLLVAGFALQGGLTLGRTEAEVWASGHRLVLGMATLVLVFFGGLQIAGELADRTAHIWLSRPITRPHFVLGKFLGVLGAGVGLLVGWTALLVGLLTSRGLTPPTALGAWLATDVLWLGVIAAIATFFSSRFAPMSASLAAGLAAILGLVAFALPVYARALGGPGPAWAALWLLYLVLPNRMHFEPQAAASADAVRWVGLVGYSFGLMGFYTLLAVWTLVRRDLL
jgi:ABC-type transport system involved in multi-copper enzyme maturation permease subunit